MTTVLKFKKLSSNATIPSLGSSLAAGFDLCSAKSCVIPAKGKGLVPTDLQVTQYEFIKCLCYGNVFY